MVRASALHVLCACPAKRLGVVMVGAAAVIFSSSAHCARPTAADAWLHWQVPLQRGWVMEVVVAAAVVFGLPVDLDRGFGWVVMLVLIGVVIVSGDTVECEADVFAHVWGLPCFE